MSEELKRCPFCGGEAHLRDCGMHLWQVKCPSCKVQQPVAFGSKETCIKAWNNRPSLWHTGTPTKKGWYVCKLKDTDLYETNSFGGNDWDETLFEKWMFFAEFEKESE